MIVKSILDTDLYKFTTSYAYMKLFPHDEVDDILSRYIPFKEYRQKHGEPLHPHDEMAESDCWSQLCVRHGEDVVNKVWSRHLASEFKRKKAPIYISRELYE